MFLKLWKNDWLAFRRSPMWKKELFQSIMLGFLAVYMAVNLIVVGFFAESMLDQYFPNKRAIKTMNGIIGYYFLFDLVLRFMFQKFPSVDIKRYILLPISKSTLSKYLMGKSFFSFFNLLPFFFLIPFFIKTMSEIWISNLAYSWLALMILLVIINQLISFLLDRTFGKHPTIGFGMMGLIMAVFYFDMKGYIELSQFFYKVIRYFSNHMIWLLLPLMIIFLLIIVIYYFLKNNAYIADDSGDQNKASSMHIGLFDHFGPVSKWMQFESKLIWRNKRSRQFIFISVLFVLYPLVFGSSLEVRSLRIFVGMFVTGAFVMNYGQLLFSWHSQHFDMILTSADEYKSFLLSKYYILALSVGVLMIISLPYAYFNRELMYVCITMGLFNVGITSFVMIVFSINFSQKIDVQKGSLFNHEGLGMAHYLLMLPVLVLPIIIYFIFRIFDYGNFGIIFLGILGLLGLGLHRIIISKITNFFFAKKYVLQKNMSTS